METLRETPLYRPVAKSMADYKQAQTVMEQLTDASHQITVTKHDKLNEAIAKTAKAVHVFISSSEFQALVTPLPKADVAKMTDAERKLHKEAQVMHMYKEIRRLAPDIMQFWIMRVDDCDCGCRTR
jgi:hypothetical protein